MHKFNSNQQIAPCENQSLIDEGIVGTMAKPLTWIWIEVDALWKCVRFGEDD